MEAPVAADTVSLPFTEVATAASQSVPPSQQASSMCGDLEQTSANNLPQSVFSTTAVNMAHSSVSLSNLTTYNEVVNKLNHLFEDFAYEIEHLTDDHWKSQEFPLARIKKIMRMDDEVKMISGEVPIMFSKAIEMFIAELTLRAWLHTEEAKRRTVQRCDVALAITKHDMFDFLIDIVPREEIQVKPKAAHKSTEGEHVQLLPPELLQLYMQLAQHQSSSSGSAEVPGEEEDGQADSTAVSGLIQQQLQLLQQLVQIQQLQHSQDLEEQQASGLSLGQTVQLQHPPQPSTPGLPSAATATVNQTAQAQLPGGQQTLHHVNPPPPPLHTIVPPELNAQDQYQQLQQLAHAPPSVQAPPTPAQTSISVEQALAEHFGTAADHHFTQSHPPPPPLLPSVVQDGGMVPEGVEFRHIPESESISRSISPITATLQSAGEEIVSSYAHLPGSAPLVSTASLTMDQAGIGTSTGASLRVLSSLPSTQH